MSVSASSKLENAAIKTQAESNQAMPHKPKVGDVLYSLPVNNAARRDKNPTPSKVIVSHVGRKYFKAGDPKWPRLHTKYYIDTWRQVTDYTATSVLYQSLGEWEDEKERDRILGLLASKFRYSRDADDISLETLKRIEALINDTV
ncbi:MAG: hypothetical protein F6K48_03065 [Okeania sp. SIO3H1]|nr:hypothetical protein [Okeania sp. SIO3H1]